MTYQYKERTADTWKGNQDRYSSNFDTFLKDEFKKKLYKATAGHNDIRILPPGSSWADYGHYGLTIFRHTNIGPRRGAFLCHNHPIALPNGQELVPGRQHNKCPVCVQNDLAQKAGNKKLSTQLYAKPGCIVWMIDRNAMEKGPQLWIMPATKVDKEILLRAYDAKRQRALPVDHPEVGFDVSFEMNQQQTPDGNFPNYSGINLDREPSPIHQDPAKLAKYLEFIEQFPLPGVLKYHDPAYILQELDGIDAPAKESEAGNSEEEIDWGSNMAPSAPAPAAPPVQTAPPAQTKAPAPAAAAAVAELPEW